MRRWFHCAPDWDTPEAEVDLRVGGKVRVVMWRPDGTEVGKSSVAKALQEVLSEPWVSLPADRVSANPRRRREFLTLEWDRRLRHGTMLATRRFLDAGLNVIAEQGLL